MQNGKNHFEATMVYNDDSIRRMFRTEYNTYETRRKLGRFGLSGLLILLAVAVDIPTAAKVLCLMVGCWLFTAPDFFSRIRAEGVLAQRNGAASTVAYRFDSRGVSVQNGLNFDFKQIDRLVWDEEYYYVFRDKQTAVMLPKAALLPNNPARFEQYLAKESGKQWQPCKGRFGFNLEDLRNGLLGRALGQLTKAR